MSKAKAWKQPVPFQPCSAEQLEQSLLVLLVINEIRIQTKGYRFNPVESVNPRAAVMEEGSKWPGRS